jgi:hypothetical protein
MPFLTKAERIIILLNKIKEADNIVIPDFLSTSCEPQKKFILDTSRKKIALCTRRASKSFAVGIMLIMEGLKHPGCSLVYINKTLQTSHRVMEKDIINPLNAHYNLNLTIVEGQVRFPNGSIIYLVGVDSSEKEKDKLLGSKYRMVCIDEAQDMLIDLEDLCERVIKPALTDLNGTLVVTGTPSDRIKTYFYELTKDYSSKNGWSFHRWSALENTSIPFGGTEPICDLVANDIAEMIKDNPEIVKSTSFRQQWLGEWVVDSKALVYHPHDYNFIDSLPKQEYQYVMGIDLGWNDASAFVIGAYSNKDKHLYLIEAYKESHLDFTQVAQVIQNYRKQYRFNRIVVDGANLQGVEEIRRRHNIPLMVAEKSDKANYIALLNSDLDAANILILNSASHQIKDEWSALIWDKNSDKLKEDPKYDNHLSDAFLYMWRIARNYLSIPQGPPKTEEELYNERIDQEELRGHDPISDLERMYQ